MMKLHWSPRSPYVRKVMVVAHELGFAPQIETVRTVVGGTTPHHELMRDNPLGKIPTLVLEDGTILYDSPVICEYLDTLHDGPKLFPPWPERLTALRRLALGDGMLDIALAWLGERFRPAERQSAPHMALWEGKLRASVAALEQEADALASGRLTIGHIAIGIALSYLDFRFGDLGWRNGHERLAEWHAAFDARPSVQANPPIDDR
jgi:glutathione S-transferase